MEQIVVFDTEFNQIPEQDNPVYNNQEVFLICKSYPFESFVPTYTLIESFTDKPFNKIGIFLTVDDAQIIAQALMLRNELYAFWDQRNNSSLEDHEIVKGIENILNK
jgi:hypothetical protein